MPYYCCLPPCYATAVLGRVCHCRLRPCYELLFPTIRTDSYPLALQYHTATYTEQSAPSWRPLRYGTFPNNDQPTRFTNSAGDIGETNRTRPITLSRWPSLVICLRTEDRFGVNAFQKFGLALAGKHLWYSSRCRGYLNPWQRHEPVVEDYNALPNLSRAHTRVQHALSHWVSRNMPLRRPWAGTAAHDTRGRPTGRLPRVLTRVQRSVTESGRCPSAQHTIGGHARSQGCM